MQIDVLMPQTGDAYAAVAAELLAPYISAFADAGMTLVPRPWDLGPGDGAATLALFAWGYHVAPVAWDALIADWPAERPLFNPPALIAWNTRKTYLLELEAAGVPVVPSLFGRADAAAIAAAFAAFGCDELVVKPQVSAGSYRTARVKRGDDIAPLDDAILQPFLPAVAAEGELSLFAIGGELSHAVRKVATGGDFRVQPQFGGAFSVLEPDAEAMGVFEATLAALPVEPLYARIDLIRRGDERLSVMEVEAIEPDLYVDLVPTVPAKLAAAIVKLG